MSDQPKRGRGRPRNGFDKKQYDRERMRRIRAEAKSNPPLSKAQKDISDE